MGRGFVSLAKKGLFFSLLLRPCGRRAQSLSSFTAFSAVAVCEAIAKVADVNPRIKWVNDIFYNGKKAGGILTEMSGDNAIIGIGLNLRTKKFPADLPNAGSLLSVAGKVTTLQMAKIIQKRLLDTLTAFDQKTILDKYRFRSILIGKRILVTAGDTSYEATALQIADDGALIVKRDDGKREHLTYGEVSVISV